MANVTRSRKSLVQTAQNVFNLLKGHPHPSYRFKFHVLKFGDNLSGRNRDMAQNMNLQSHDIESQGHL